MNLGCARGMPVRLTSTEVEMLMCEGSMVEVVSEVMVSLFVDVSNDENDALKWAKLVLVILVWLFGCEAVCASFLFLVGFRCVRALDVNVGVCH